MRVRIFLALAFGLAFLGAAAPARANSEWKVIKVRHWDYLSVDNIAKFYDFPGPVTPNERSIHLENGTNQLELTLESREAIINGVRNWLCFPVIEGSDGKYLVSRIDLAKTIEPQLRPHMIKNMRTVKTVVIDAGHGGIENGAASSYGSEKTFTLDVAKRLKTLLEAKGFKVVMTRTSDEVVPLPLRARIANATRDSIFVSLHFNATDTNSSATGLEIYSLTPRGAPSTQDNSLQARFANMQAGSPVDAASLILSTSVYHAMLGYLPEFDRGVKRARFAVLRLTQIPAILVEGGFLTERQESREIANPEWRQKLAQAISVGIENYKTLAETKRRPMLLADYRRQFEGVLVARDGNAAPTEESAVYPAANTHAGLAAQVTEPLRHEPSPQMSVNDIVGQAGIGFASASAESAPPIASPEVLATANEPQPPPSIDAAQTNPPSPSAVTAAGVGDPPSTLAESDAEFPVAVPSESAPAAPAPVRTPAKPPVVHKYWVLKFNPPPKFRE
ncbi:MAG: N-acetylmuramoyl-L-alanine amidase [Chthoniobacterales bacterium]